MILKNLSSTVYNRQNIRRDVLNLLRRRRRSEGQLVAVQTSTIKNAGRGVFCQKENIKAGTALCLYPGVYTPPLPCTGGSQGEDLYLAGSELENRAYIMNLPEIGGHIDGEDDDIPGARENPSAIGHFVNHPSKANGQYPNVEVVSFMWSDIFRPIDCTTSSNTDSGRSTCIGTTIEEKVMYESSDDCASGPLFDVPNVPRADGSPWFYDGTAGEIVYFPDNTGEIEMGPDVGSPSGCEATSTGGALIYATTDLHKGDECYLDYSLQKQYPAWAKDWYEPVT